MEIFSKAEHASKHQLPKLSNVSGNDISSKLKQFLNAAPPIEIVPSGITTLFNAIHFSNAYAPIVFISVPRFISTKSGQSANAESLIT